MPNCLACLRKLPDEIPLVPVCAECWPQLSIDTRAQISSNWQLQITIADQGVADDGATQFLRAAKAMERAARDMAELKDLAVVIKNQLWLAREDERPWEGDEE